MPEDIAVRTARPDEIFVDERLADRFGTSGKVWRDRLHAGRPERPPEDRADLDEPALVLGQPVEPGEDGRLHGVGERVDGAASFHQGPNELAGVERIALGPRDDPVDDLRLP